MKDSRRNPTTDGRAGDGVLNARPLGVVADTGNLSTQDADAGGLFSPDQAGTHQETYSETQRSEKVSKSIFWARKTLLKNLPVFGFRNDCLLPP